MNSAAEWLASIPDELTAREALVFVEQALQDAAAATKQVAARFQGTVPPPPWPQHPELVKAIAAMEGGRLMLMQGINLGYGDQKQPKSGATGIRLQTAGRQLYAEIARMQQRGAELPKAANVPELLARAGAAAAKTSIGGWVTLGVLLWALRNIEDLDG